LLEKYTPLYLKYRPQSLAELVGQHSVAQTLINAIEHDRICHAYLFTGPRGTGKTSSARILAKSLNCEKGPTVTPCQTCSQCIEIKDGNSPAVFELDAASNNSVDDARALIERAPLVAQGGRHKLYIIDECHMLTKEAFNALLKTIEEPPPGVIFVLATTEEHKVPPTIVSRCQRLMFKLVNQDELKVHLRNVAEKESINIDEDALELVARRSGGGLRDALGLLDQAGLLSTSEKPVGVSDLLSLLGAVQEDVLLQISAGIRDKDGSAVLSSIHSLLVDGREPAVLIQEMAKHFLNLARSCYNLSAKKSQGNHSAHPILGSPSYLAGLTEQAESYDPTEIAQIVELLDKLEQNVRRSSQPAMNLEMGLLSICHRHEIRMLHELEDRLAKLEGAMTDNGIEMPSSRTTSHGASQGAARTPSQSAAAGLHAPGRPAATPSYAQASPPAAYKAPQAAQAAPSYAQPAPVASSPVAPPPVPPSPTVSVTPATPPTVASAPAASPAEPASPAAQPVPPAAALSLGDDEDEYVPDSSDDRDDEDAVSGAPSVAQVVAPTYPTSSPEPADAPPALSTHAPTTPAPSGTTPAARPVPQPQSAPAESTSSLSSSNVSNTELDELWSDITEALQGRHLPTYSILTTCAFPVSFDREKADLVIGVRKDHFLKMIENKSEHIKGAFASITGKTITVRVKVIGEDGPGSGPAPRPNARPAPAAASGHGSGSGPSSGGGGEPRPSSRAPGSAGGEESDRVDAQRQTVEASTGDGVQSRSSAQVDARAGQRNEPQRQQAQSNPAMTATMDRPEPAVDRKPDHNAARRAPNVAAGASDSGLVSDAYRIFEGPGSRLLN
jgi:DNA polymerase III subunit gamma/tau